MWCQRKERRFFYFLESLSEPFLCLFTKNMFYAFWRTRCVFLRRRHSCSSRTFLTLFYVCLIWNLKKKNLPPGLCWNAPLCRALPGQYALTHTACMMDARSTIELIFDVRRVSNELAFI